MFGQDIVVFMFDCSAVCLFFFVARHYNETHSFVVICCFPAISVDLIVAHAECLFDNIVMLQSCNSHIINKILHSLKAEAGQMGRTYLLSAVDFNRL